MKKSKKKAKGSTDEEGKESPRTGDAEGLRHNKAKKHEERVEDENHTYAQRGIISDKNQKRNINEEEAESIRDDGPDQAQDKPADKKKKKKRTKDKKRRREEPTEKDTSLYANESTSEMNDTRNQKAKKSEDVDDNADSTTGCRNGEKFKTETPSKEKRQQRKAERQRLMDLVPLSDENGIAYTKLQIRRMRKRVARGLPPLETEEEMRERQRDDALLRKEEEAELQGMVYQKDGTVKPEDGDDEDETDDERNKGDNAMEHVEDKDESIDALPLATNTDTDTSSKASPGPPPKKKTRRNKPVPADYVCQACKNKETPPLHWIYDCPLKVTIPGCNHKSSKNHVNEPSDLKVFVSGLPFDTKSKDVRQLFSPCGSIRHIKLLTFEDTGRCKGNAFLTFENKEAALAALKISGTALNGGGEEEDKTDKKRKTLTLKVSKVLNRTLTKRNGGKVSLKK